VAQQRRRAHAVRLRPLGVSLTALHSRLSLTDSEDYSAPADEQRMTNDEQPGGTESPAHA
jgi:hypothetical protein